MTGLADYLVQKRAALDARAERLDRGELGATQLSARVTAEGRSGVRRIRVRDFQLVSDSPPWFAGYDLGPGSPELQLGVLGSCLTHTFLIQAAARGVVLDALEVEVTGVIDPRSGRPGFEAVPVFPHDLRYTVELESNASDEELAELRSAVEATCPLYNLLRNPQTITGEIVRSAVAV